MSFDRKCPRDQTPCADVKVIIFIRDEVINQFEGYLCSTCRTIWSPTEISSGIELKKII